jgi:hypothetical protein
VNPISKSQSDRFEKSLFRCEPEGKTFWGMGSLLTPGNFSLGKNSTEKEVSPTSHQIFNPSDIHNVNARSNDHIPIGNFRLQIVDLKSEI